MWDGLRQWWYGLLGRRIHRLQKWTRTVDARVQHSHQVSQEARQSVDRVLRQLDAMKHQHDDAITRLRKELQDADARIQKQDRLIEDLREQIQVAEEITVPSLVAAHDVLLQRWRAESSILVMRSGINGVEGE